MDLVNNITKAPNATVNAIYNVLHRIYNDIYRNGQRSVVQMRLITFNRT